MPWKRRNQNTCNERVFFAEILSPNIKNFQRIFFKLSSFLVSQNVFNAIIAIEHDFRMHKHLPGPSGRVKNLGLRPWFLTLPSGPGEC